MGHQNKKQGWMEREACVWHNKEKSFIENFIESAKRWPEVSFRKMIHLIIIAVTMSFSYRRGKLSISLGTRLQIRLQLGNDIHSSKLNLIPAWLCNVVCGGEGEKEEKEKEIIGCADCVMPVSEPDPLEEPAGWYNGGPPCSFYLKIQRKKLFASKFVLY